MSYKSLTINERYNILKEFGKIEKENTVQLIQWRNDMSLCHKNSSKRCYSTISMIKRFFLML